MFGKLKEKLKNWTKKISEKETKEEAPKEETVKPEKDIQEKLSSEELEKLTDEELDDKLKKEVSRKKYKKTQKKYDIALQKVEPDLEKIEEEVEEAPMIEILPKKEKKSIFKKISSKIGKTKISEENFQKYSEDLEMILLENNVALEVAEKIIVNLKNEIIEHEFSKKELESQIKQTLKKIISEILIPSPDFINKVKQKKPFIILFCGINGTGKTTSIAKVAHLLKKNKLSCVLAAADTFRAASIEQIKEHGENLNVKVISHEYNSDPASVGFDAIKYAEKNKIDCVLIDTAGRIHTDKNLMQQIQKISKVCKPDLKIFVGESITGNDSVEQIKSFNETIEIDGIILSKADIDEKGGTALSLGQTTGKPILFLGTGQNYENLEIFNKEKFLEKLGL